ncbi:MAG: hypothetical protein HA490_04275 [Archaeoglobales archaeon]|nr:hypothetical protein [Archaeoglobales archaeon]
MRVPEIVEKLWEKYGLGENVRKHCIAVAEMALKITESVERRGYRSIQVLKAYSFLSVEAQCKPVRR